MSQKTERKSIYAINWIIPVGIEECAYRLGWLIKNGLGDGYYASGVVSKTNDESFYFEIRVAFFNLDIWRRSMFTEEPPIPSGKMQGHLMKIAENQTKVLADTSSAMSSLIFFALVTTAAFWFLLAILGVSLLVVAFMTIIWFIAVFGKLFSVYSGEDELALRIQQALLTKPANR